MGKSNILLIIILFCLLLSSCNNVTRDTSPDGRGDITYIPQDTKTEVSQGTEAPQDTEVIMDYNSSSLENEYGNKAIKYINESRSNNDLPILETSPNLTAAANIRAREISDKDNFSSTRPNGQDWVTVADEYNVKYTAVAENIASGYATPEDFIQSMINKGDSNNTILSDNYNKVGVGVYKKGGNTYWELLLINDEAFQPIPKDEYAKVVLELTNIQRKNEGLQELETYVTLQQVADRRSAETVEVFDHIRPDGRDIFTTLDEYGIKYMAAGENLAKGQSTPEEVVDGWMNSEGHRNNILNGDFNHMGVGVYQYEGVIYWTQFFTD